MKFLTLFKQFLKRYRGSKILKTAGDKTVNEPNILCKISIRSQEQLFSLSFSYFQKKFILQNTLNIQCFSLCNLLRNWLTYVNEGENVNKYPPTESILSRSCFQQIMFIIFSQGSQVFKSITEYPQDTPDQEQSHMHKTSKLCLFSTCTGSYA